MSKKGRREVLEARSDREAFIAVASQYKQKLPPQTPEEISRIERAAQEKSASYAVRDWPECLAERQGFKLAQLTNGNQAMAVAAASAYGFFGARLFMKGFAAAVGPAPYEREGGR